MSNKENYIDLFKVPVDSNTDAVLALGGMLNHIHLGTIDKDKGWYYCAFAHTKDIITLFKGVHLVAEVEKVIKKKNIPFNEFRQDFVIGNIHGILKDNKVPYQQEAYDLIIKHVPEELIENIKENVAPKLSWLEIMAEHGMNENGPIYDMDKLEEFMKKMGYESEIIEESHKELRFLRKNF